ncbi:MAG: histidine--tRNA ligase [Vicingaceae bacterium]|nr:histidine--tRNA ligase [Vicingaceae bacterium]
MSNKPSIPKGTRDFSPIEMARRNYIFDTIKKVYKKYGFQQIETPAMENLNTLIGTGGDESDTLIFKILNSGDYLKKADEKALNDKDSNGLTRSIAEKALHYDLTVPFARYVVQNQNDITFPFRRFQIQPVWRADRPQKGRYREFYQCDADIIGSNSLLNEVDLIKIIDDVFSELFQGKLNYKVSFNNRKILAGIAESFGVEERLEEMTVIIDKLDKIWIDGVVKELEKKSFSTEISLFIRELITNSNPFDLLKHKFINSEIGLKGIEELEYIRTTINQIGLINKNVIFDPTLARGLGYYTGTIIEVKVENFPSICGGGRYDDLTGKFGLKDVSGVGISFGADRIYDVLLDNNLYPKFEGDSTQVLFTNQTGNDEEVFLPMLFKLRDAGINAEIYPDEVKWKRQMNYASKKNIEYIVSSNFDGELFVKKSDNQDKIQFKTAEELITLIQK